MLFKTTNKLIEFAELSTTVNFNNVKLTIRMIEQQHIIPAIGQELYALLDDAYTAAADENTLSDKYKILLEKVRDVIGPLVCYYYLPKADVKLSDSGAQRIETGTNKTAYQNQVLNFREQNLRESEMATELLLQFLEDKKTDYPQWQSSEAFAEYRSLFIKSGKEFDKNFRTASPCRNYMAMRSRMVDVENHTIKKLLGAELFAALKKTDADPDGVFSDPEKELLIKIKKAVAYLTVAESIPFLNVRIDTNGLTVMASNRAQNDEMATRQTAADKALNAYIDAAREAGQAWVNDIADWIKENITVTVVVDTVETPSGNTERKGNFGLI